MAASRDFGPCPRCGAIVLPLLGVPAIDDADRPRFCGQCGADLRPPNRIPRLHRSADQAREAGPNRPIRSDADFMAYLEALAASHGLTAADVLREMRADAEKKIAEASTILALIRRLEDTNRLR